MTIMNDLMEMLTDTVTWVPLTSRDDYGNPIEGTSYQYPARLVRKTKLIRNKDQQQVTSTAQVWIGPNLVSGEPLPMVKNVDKVTLSDGTSPQIASIEIYQDETGFAYTEVFFL